MNESLAVAVGAALRELGDELTDDWRRIVMVKNDGPIPIPAASVPGDPTRGFNLLILSERGTPTHYVRCRDRSNAALAREGDLLRNLAGVGEVRPHLPDCAGGSSGTMQVLATRFMDGRNFAHLVRGMESGRWQQCLMQLTDVATRIARAAQASIYAGDGDGDFSFAAEARGPLEVLGKNHLPADDIERLHAILIAAGMVPRFPQHGDLWPGNIMLDHGTWRLLDFESFGQIQAPLFDACHLTVTSLEYLLTGGNGFPKSWLEYVQQRDSLGTAAVEVLHHNAEAHGLSRAQAMGSMTFYLAELAARLIRRRADRAITGIPVQELAMIASLTAGGASVDSIIFPGLAQ